MANVDRGLPRGPLTKSYPRFQPEHRWKCYKLAYEVGLDICTNFSESLSDQKVSGILWNKVIKD